jgi:hypothetical protein
MPRKALLWLLVPIAGLAELGAHFYFSKRPPRPEEWQGVRDTVAALRQHGELVVAAPAWADPNARFAFGDALMPIQDSARPDESAYARAIEVSIVGARTPELKSWRVVDEQRQGKFRIRVLENPAPVLVLYDFVDHVSDASVADERGGQKNPCPWNPNAYRSAGGLHGDPAFPAQRFDCHGGPERFVGVTVVEDEQWRGRRCLWAEPPQGGELVIEFNDVPIGKVVRGYGTLPWWIERELRGTPVEMTVSVAGQALGTYVHKDGDGWKPFEFATGAHAGTRGSVEFRVRSAQANGRQFCFQADTR